MARRTSAKRRPAPDGAAPARPVLEAVQGRLGLRSSLALDRMIHERVRLAIVSALAVNDTLGFSELKDITGATDGNLSVHARKLENAGYVACRKSFRGRVPRTEYRLTLAGRQALESYLEHMENLIRATRGR